MTILGIVLLLLGLLFNISILFYLGLILILVGVFLVFVPVNGTRRRYW